MLDPAGPCEICGDQIALHAGARISVTNVHSARTIIVCSRCANAVLDLVDFPRIGSEISGPSDAT